MTTTSPVEDITDLFDERMFSDPHPRYRELRDHRPLSLARTALGPEGTWLLTRYDDVMLLHTDDRFSSESEPPSGFRERLLPRFPRLPLASTVLKDDPHHTNRTHEAEGKSVSVTEE